MFFGGRGGLGGEGVKTNLVQRVRRDGGRVRPSGKVLFIHITRIDKQHVVVVEPDVVEVAAVLGRAGLELRAHDVAGEVRREDERLGHVEPAALELPDQEALFELAGVVAGGVEAVRVGGRGGPVAAVQAEDREGGARVAGVEELPVYGVVVVGGDGEGEGVGGVEDFLGLGEGAGEGEEEGWGDGLHGG